MSTKADSASKSITHQVVHKAVPANSPILFKGSCACGRITYESRSLLELTQACHCVTCQKLSGGPFQAFAAVQADQVSFHDQQQQSTFQGLPASSTGSVTFSRLSEIARRLFCAACHSSLAMQYDDSPTTFGLTLGTVDEASITDEEVRKTLKPGARIFMSQRAWWHDGSFDHQRSFDRFAGYYEKKEQALQEQRERDMEASAT